jgi:two-component system CheB/CheR fusion protein
LPADDPAPSPPVDEPAAQFPIVGIGASAGGLPAFEAFFAAMPKDDASGMAFVLVQHLSPDHDSLLANLVQRYTRMQVREATDGMVVEPNSTYIIPPSHDMRLVGGALVLTSHGPERKPRHTIDCFFESGTGSDGTLGLREVKGEGGLVIAQSPDSTEYDGMPRSAIATGMVDYVLEPAEMPAHLIAYARHAFDPARRPSAGKLGDATVKKLCLLLRSQTGHDFSQYKETTLVRRMERRMALKQIGAANDYLRHARENPSEVDALFRDLLIGVTQFFRDPPAFEALEHDVLPRLIGRKTPQETVRVWVPGCSTGEEAYSIAILLHEMLSAQRRPVRVQVFATDIDRQALERARLGVYPASIATRVSEERLARFFTHDAQRATYRIQKQIRNLLVFSEQDLIKDPPFSRLDLVSCRNLLIYLNTELQKRLIPLFHYALRPGGALFLGSSETVGDSASMFSLADRKWKLYWRLEADHAVHRPALAAFVPTALADIARAVPSVARAVDEAALLRQLTERALLSHCASAGVLVNARGQILHIIGRTGQFLEPADGGAAMNVLTMARDGLRQELTLALHRCVAHKEVVRAGGLNVKSNGHYIRADLAVRPVERSGGEACYLVVLQALADAPAGTAPTAHQAEHESRIDDLETALRNKEEYLQTTLEEMETTNEELKSTNEEMQSINEELQSTNEELETSKEELQSVNEELSTVNTELQDRVSDLSRANNDMNNLLAGTGVGTVFVDHQLRIARFTPAATPVLNFIASDVGRPLEHVATNLLNYDRLVEDVAHVLDALTPLESEVQVKGGAWYLMRIRPYRTTNNLIEGAVITLVDISARKKAEAAVRASEARLNAFVHQAYAGVGESDLDGRLMFVNDRLCDLLGQSRDELVGRRMADLTEPADADRVRVALESLGTGAAAVRVTRRYRRQDGSTVPVQDRVSVIRDGSGRPASVLWLSVDEALG